MADEEVLYSYKTTSTQFLLKTIIKIGSFNSSHSVMEAVNVRLSGRCAKRSVPQLILSAVVILSFRAHVINHSKLF